MLTAFARALGALPPAMPFPPTYRELAYALCEGMRCREGVGKRRDARRSRLSGKKEPPIVSGRLVSARIV